MRKMTSFFGICDLLSILILFGSDFLRNRVSLYSDVLDAVEISRQLDSPMPVFIAFLGVCLFVSILFSGVLLISYKKIGAFLVYVQFPLRIFLAMPSFAFVALPLRSSFSNSFTISSFMVTAEFLKLLLVIKWHRTA